MGLRKGMTNNPKGRPRHKPNRTTTETKTIVNDILGKNFDVTQVTSDLKKLEPRHRLEILLKLLNFILPKPLNELENLDDNSLDRLIEKLKNERYTIN